MRLERGKFEQAGRESRRDMKTRMKLERTGKERDKIWSAWKGEKWERDGTKEEGR